MRVKCEYVKCEGVKCEGVKCEGVKCDVVRMYFRCTQRRGYNLGHCRDGNESDAEKSGFFGDM